METINMEDIKRHATGHWFEDGATRFFKSRYSQFGIKAGNKAFFVTSEKYEDSTPKTNYARLYTVRAMDWLTGKVDTVSEFQQYTNKDQANRAMKIFAEKEEKNFAILSKARQAGEPGETAPKPSTGTSQRRRPE
jgi:hypothetical protein